MIKTELQKMQEENRDYKQIEEDELINYLNNGWQIIQQLKGTNKVIISKKTQPEA